MICAAQNLHIVIDEDDGVPVGHKLPHDVQQSVNVRGMESDGRLVKNVEHARRPIAHSTRELHTLPLPRRERRGRAVEREIAESKLHEARRRMPETLTDAFRHRNHILRHSLWNICDPRRKFRQRHPADIRQRALCEAWRTCGIREACAVTGRTDFLAQEFFHTLHSLFILDLRERIFYGINCIEVGEVHLPRRTGLLDLIDQMHLVGRSVKDDLLFLRSQFAKRHIRPHAEFLRDLLHQRPHERLPRQHCPIVDREGVVGHERRFVNDADNAGTSARLTGTAAVEREFLRTRCIEMYAARRADDLLFRRHLARRRCIVTVRAAMARQTRKHQTYDVQQLRRRAERAAHSGHAGALMQCKRRRDVAHLIDACLLCLCHAPPRIRRQRLEIAARTLGVEHAQCERGLSRAGDPRNTHNLMKRNIDRYIFQIVNTRPADFDRHRLLFHCRTSPLLLCAVEIIMQFHRTYASSAFLGISNRRKLFQVS